MNTKLFKAYDIRGVYPKDIDEEGVETIGRATVLVQNARALAVGRDNRDSSPSLFDAFTHGIANEEADIIDIGLCSTPMLYFASATLPVDGAAMITASHNPPEYNGIKICGKNAIPFGLASGLGDIRDRALLENFSDVGGVGTRTTCDITKDYRAFISSFASFHGKHFRIATDTAHAMGVLEIPVFETLPGITFAARLYDGIRPPGTCPHEANPLVSETLHELAQAVIQEKADIGFAFDGDADRIGFVDEKGTPVPMDLITAILAPEVLLRHPGATILYDLRSSRSVKEEIERAGGVAHECPVGHANIKKQMREEGAVFAGELSGHYYFTEKGYSAEMGALPAILLLNRMARTGKTLSQLVAAVRRYAHSGEINFTVTDTKETIARVRDKYKDGHNSDLDGLKVSYPSWWFSLRASNTEPLLRLNLEADSPSLMEEKKRELIALLEETSSSTITKS